MRTLIVSSSGARLTVRSHLDLRSVSIRFETAGGKAHSQVNVFGFSKREYFWQTATQGRLLGLLRHLGFSPLTLPIVLADVRKRLLGMGWEVEDNDD